jgi:uncharacterized protein YbaA (DUF1428 family)
MAYISGFLAAVPTANKQAFIHHTLQTASAFRDHGLSSALEAWGTDVPDGDATSMIKALSLKDDETAIFAFYRWPDLETYRAATLSSMQDPRLDPNQNEMPFDVERVHWGNFTPLLELGAQKEGGYFDAFILPIPKAAKAEYLEFAKFGDAIFLEHGANWCVECWEDDIPADARFNFHKAVAKKDDEAIVFCWAQWPSKAARDAGNDKIHHDPRFTAESCPFDMSRMIFGGFERVMATQWNEV